MPKLITCSFCGGDGLEELFGEMPGSFGTCTNCAGTGKTESRSVEPFTYDTYIAEAKKRAATMKMPGAMVFPRSMQPIHKMADNGIDVIIDEAATRAHYWGEDTKSRLDCASKFAHAANFRGVPEIPGQDDVK